MIHPLAQPPAPSLLKRSFETLNDERTKLHFPQAPKERHYHVDHGVRRPDDYFWMRNKQDIRFITYLKECNLYTDAYMGLLKPFSEKLRKEMEKKVEPEFETIPYKIGDHYYFEKYVFGEEHFRYCRKSESGTVVLFNPNNLENAHSYLDVRQFLPSPNGQYALITLDFTGSGFGTTKIWDLELKQFYSIDLPHTNGNLVWNSTSKGFWYIELDAVKRFSKLKYHEIGTQEDSDILIFEEKDEFYDLQIGHDKQNHQLIVTTSSKDNSRIYLASLETPSPLAPFNAPFENSLHTVWPSGHGTYVVANRDKGNFGLYRQNRDGQTWETLFAPHQDSTIEKLEIFERFVVIKKRTKGILSLEVFDPHTLFRYEIPLPHSLCEIDFYNNTNYNSNVVWFTISSPIVPFSIYEWNIDTKVRRLLWQDKAGGFDSALYTSERILAYNDNVAIPISLFYKKGLQRSQNTPLLLYVYGAYGMTSDLSFSPEKSAVLERDCIFAIAHVRGGGDLGHVGYEEGKMGKKINTVTDLIACAETLINKGYTSPQKLALEGGSAGGLAVGAAINRRPELFRCCLVYVPFVDAVTTMFDKTIPLTSQERKEFGNPEIKEEYQWLVNCSPYDGIKSQDYPSLFVISGYNDEQVGPWEPAKWVAKLKDFKTDENPLLLWVNMHAGHSGPVGRYERYGELSVALAFLFEQWR